MLQVTVSVPATSANLGPGYDCLGLAFDLRHEVTFSAVPTHELKISASGEDHHMIPITEENLVHKSAEIIFKHLNWRPAGLHIRQENKIPIGSGLGSSSSAVLAGMFGANALAGSPLSKLEILQMATHIEGHPDNVAPAVFGGLILGIQGGNGLVVEQLPIPALEVVIVLPDFQLLTADARAALPKQVPLSDAIFNASRVGFLIRALETADYAKLRVAMQDRLHQPYRISLIPGMKEAFQAARDAGAAGVALSGAGPSLIAFAADGHDGIAAAAALAFALAGYSSRTWKLVVDHKGVEISSPVHAG
jgi:homoserine kinase